MNKSLSDRLNKIVPRLTSDEFIKGSGLGNEIGFHIFDYPPEKELIVRDHMHVVINQLKQKKSDLKVQHINLFELLINHLKQRNLLDKAIKIQKEKGDEAIRKALSGPLNEEKIAKVFSEEAQPDKNDIIIISGVGTAWPLLRSHTLLNNLHPLMHGAPLVVFYPGVYDGQGLSLFGKLKDNNYYRAFQLVT